MHAPDYCKSSYRQRLLPVDTQDETKRTSTVNLPVVNSTEAL